MKESRKRDDEVYSLIFLLDVTLSLHADIHVFIQCFSVNMKAFTFVLLPLTNVNVSSDCVD